MSPKKKSAWRVIRKRSGRERETEKGGRVGRKRKKERVGEQTSLGRAVSVEFNLNIV